MPSSLSLPEDHQPRYEDFELDCLVDETVREGSERCLFAAVPEDRLRLIHAIVEAGARDLVIASGVEDPPLLLRCLSEKLEKGAFPPDTRFVFVVLLNTWRPLYEQFKTFPREYLRDASFSFGKISYKKDEQLLERVIDKFTALGAELFRASLLNAFSSGVDAERYATITSEIDRCASLGFNVIRINDSVGLLYPEVTAVLAANLVRDYPSLDFCLHAHDDRGLGLANALASVENGFNMIEGSAAGFGNRSGLPSLECIHQICEEKGIRIRNSSLRSEKLREAARMADQTFMVLPDLYRPISGMLVEKENFGVLNIPDFLGIQRDRDYFLNPVGLYPAAVSDLVEEAGLQHHAQDDHFIEQIRTHIAEQMWSTAREKRTEFNELSRRVEDLYLTGIVTPTDVKRLAEKEASVTKG